MAQTVPQNQVWGDGQGSVPASWLNTTVEVAQSVSSLRNFVGLDNMEVLLLGFISPGDGGQGTFYYSTTATPVDDSGVTCVVPNGVAQGAWIRLSPSTGGGTGLAIARAPVYILDGGGSAITTGANKGTLYLPFAVTLTSVALTADQSGSCVIDIGLIPIASYTGAFPASITASDMPTLSSAVHYLDTALTGWTKAIPAGSVLVFKVVSAATITRLTITLGCVG